MGGQEKSTWYNRLHQSTTFTLLRTLFSVVTYTQDIIQDVLVISNTINSNEIYSIQTIMKVREKDFGFAMIGIFCLSVLIVGMTTILQMSRLALLKKYPKIYILLILSNLVNLGPVFVMIMKWAIDRPTTKKTYKNADEYRNDKRIIEQTLSSAKTKEAICENLPMLVIVCFKMALSSRFSWIEAISGFSSALLFSNVFLNFTKNQLRLELGFLWTALANFFMAIFMHSTLLLITSFAIESEQEGIFTASDPRDGAEESSGLVFLLLLLPTVFFCLLPLTIHDMIPVFITDSSSNWQRFQDPPHKIWYSSTVFCALALCYNLGTASHFLQRDPIEFDWSLPTMLYDNQCDILGLSFPSSLCGKWDLKVGAGRVYFKVFTIISMIISSLAYLFVSHIIFGMSYDDRNRFKRAYQDALEQETEQTIKDLKLMIHHGNCSNDINLDQILIKLPSFDAESLFNFAGDYV